MICTGKLMYLKISRWRQNESTPGHAALQLPVNNQPVYICVSSLSYKNTLYPICYDLVPHPMLPASTPSCSIGLPANPRPQRTTQMSPYRTLSPVSSATNIPDHITRLCSRPTRMHVPVLFPTVPSEVSQKKPQQMSHQEMNILSGMQCQVSLAC